MPRSKTKTKRDEVIEVTEETPLPQEDEAPPEEVTSTEEKTLFYEKFRIEEWSTAVDDGPLYPEDMRTFLRWETEEEYQKRQVEEKGGEATHYLYGDTYHCVNENKDKVRCWNNANNRPFDTTWCEDLIHTILSGQWAGPHTYPGETVNGETIRISRYGRVLSGQHTGTALILADERLQKERKTRNPSNPPKYPFWEGHEHPFIETCVATGVSEDERVLRTIDYVKPRTLADMLFTMEVFKNNSQAERKEMTRMLATAAETLWNRTGAKGYRTHPEMDMFIQRHKRLLKCVEHLFVENNSKGLPQYVCKECRWTAWVQYSHCGRCGGTNIERRDDGGRPISKLRLSPGQCAALCYLMGSSGPKTDGDEYRHDIPPGEGKHVSWEYWDRAREFWARLASDRGFTPVRHALNKLVDTSPTDDDRPGLGGRGPEKLAILSKAWDIFKDHPIDAGDPFTMEDLKPGGALHLSYDDKTPVKIKEKESVGGEPLPYGQIRLIDTNEFGGIDVPPPETGKNAGTDDPKPPSEDDIWGRGGLTEQIREKREEKVDKKRTVEADKRQKASVEERVAKRDELLSRRDSAPAQPPSEEKAAPEPVAAPKKIKRK